MASGTAKSSRRTGPVVAGSGTSLQYDQFIEQQLARTRRRVKLVDLGCMVMGLIGGVILYLMIVVGIDHWLLPLNTVGRFLALAGLLLGVGYYLAAYLGPMLLRRINPAYAARTIERSDPSLKNSLVNFLMFRRDASATSRLVFQALRQKAALDLRQVNVDLAVDRSRLIHVGYVVVTLMVLFAVYTVFSPKDVFQTVKRVSAPWMDIAPPTRVIIASVTPQDTEKIRGEHVSVTAQVRGLADDDAVTLYYSTADAQIANRAVVMTRSDQDASFQTELPVDPNGIQQTLTYHIEAGDARSAEYTVTLLETPTILVDRVSYVYPPYTGRDPQVVEREGEIRAIEGTRVTIHARTNHPIANQPTSNQPTWGAKITFHSDPAGSESSGSSLQMNLSDEHPAEATYSFTLQDIKGETQPYAGYRLNFVSAATGKKSLDTTFYKISMSRDLRPDIEILTPQDNDIEVPINGTQRIEIRAIDPDFGLSQVRLVASVGGRELLRENLLGEPQNATGQVVLSYDFSPARLGLAVGDRVVYHAEAQDNRDLPDLKPPKGPHSVPTGDYVITIVSPDPSAAGNSGGTSDQSPEGETEQQQPKTGRDESSETSQQADRAGSASESPKSNSPGQNDTRQSESGTTGEKNQQSSSGESGQTGQSQSDQQESGGSPAGDQGEQSDQGQAGKEGPQQEGSQTGDAGSETAGEQGGTDGSSGQQQGAGSQGSTGNQPGNGTHDSARPAGTGGTPNGEAGEGSDGSPNGMNNGAGRDNQSPGGREERLHDGEVIERAMQYFQDSGQSSPSPGADRSGDRPAGRQDGTDNQDSPRGDGNKGGAETSNGNQAGGSSDASAADQQGAPSDTTHGEGTSAAPRNGAGTQDTSGSKKPAAQSGPDHEDAAGDGQSDRPSTGPDQSKTAPAGTDNAGHTERSQRERSSTGDQQGEPGSGQDAGSGTSSKRPEAGADPRQARPGGDRDSGGGRKDSDPSAADSAASGTGEQPPSGDAGAGQGDERDAGERGPGQSAAPKQPEHDPSGSKMSSDQGEAGSAASGEGPSADRTGDALPSPDRAGQPGQKTDAASQSSAAKGEESPTSDAAPPQHSETPPGKQDTSASDSADRPGRGDSRGAAGNGLPDGGGLPSDSAIAPDERRSEVPEGDEANLEYARQATDLVLERLKDQQNEPDPELLKRLGWNQEELRQFIARWEALKRAAREEGGDARTELDDALRSLGLRTTVPQRRTGGGRDDQQRGMTESGTRSRPPAEFLEQFNAYKRGAARGSRDGG